MTGAVKLILICVVFICATGAGFRLASEDKAKLARLEGLLSLIGHIKRQIEYFSSPLSDIYNNFSCRELDECGFTQILRNDIPGDDGGYGKNNSFCCAVRKLRKELSLNDGIYTALIEFGSTLGCCCSEELISRCSFLEELLSEACALQREELPKKTRLHTSLGAGLGMMLVILLI